MQIPEYWLMGIIRVFEDYLHAFGRYFTGFENCKFLETFAHRLILSAFRAKRGIRDKRPH